MDDELHQLEAELKRLRPAAPSRALLARLAGELDGAEPVGASRASQAKWWWAAALPIAAALALAAYFSAQRVTPDAPGGEMNAVVVKAAVPPEAGTTGIFKPVAAENVLYAVSDEGVVTLEDGTAARRERLSYVDTITWKNPRTNASVRWTVPREEVRVTPVKFQ